MKRRVLGFAIAVLCVGFGSLAAAQQGAVSGNPSSEQLPAEVCLALEPFIAKIDAARSIREKPRRQEKYVEAQTVLEPVLKRLRQEALLTATADYVRYTELVAAADPTDPKFDEYVRKRLDVRSALLEACSAYTSSR